MVRQISVDVGDRYTSVQFGSAIKAAAQHFISFSAFGPTRPVLLDFEDIADDAEIDAAIVAATNHIVVQEPVFDEGVLKGKTIDEILAYIDANWTSLASSREIFKALVRWLWRHRA